MSKGLEATKRLKWGLDITHEERINLCECIEKELKEHEQYKAIEKELGIDLITLFKAISNGVWVKTKNDISKHLTVALKKRHHTKEYWLFYRPYSHVYLKDYGKTWALTKEELEKC